MWEFAWLYNSTKSKQKRDIRRPSPSTAARVRLDEAGARFALFWILPDGYCMGGYLCFYYWGWGLPSSLYNICTYHLICFACDWLTTRQRLRVTRCQSLLRVICCKFDIRLVFAGENKEEIIVTHDFHLCLMARALPDGWGTILNLIRYNNFLIDRAPNS